MRRQHVRIRTYLLLNLVLLAFLLIILWRTDTMGAADLNIRFPTLLLVLLVLNTVLLFRDYLRPCYQPKKDNARTTRCSSVRELLSAPVDEAALKEVLERVAADCRAKSACFLARDESDCAVPAVRVGSMHVVLTTGRFLTGSAELKLRHPGGLGEEQLWTTSGAGGFQPFRSHFARFEGAVLPIWFAGRVVAWFILEAAEEHPLHSRRLEEASIFLQGIGALWFQQSLVSNAANFDPVLQLPRFADFQDALEIELERSERYSQNLTLLNLSVCTAPGSSAAVDDPLLQAAAQSLKDSLRRLDQAFVGETRGRFAALLTETTPEVARLVAERIQTAFLRRVSQRESERSSGVVLRMGSATYPTDASHAGGLQEKADEALQRAVAKGLNFVTWSGVDGAESAEAEPAGVPYKR